MSFNPRGGRPRTFSRLLRAFALPGLIRTASEKH